MSRYFILFLGLFSIKVLFAQPTQTIHGSVVDEASNAPIPFATLVVLNTNPPIGTTTNENGTFCISHVPVGRYDIQVSHISYQGIIQPEIIVTSARQTSLTVKLKENPTALSEVVVSAQINKEQPLNTMAAVSTRMLSVEEARRYAGGFDDPGRLATAFAGTSGNTDVNGIIVRGNAPKFVQWKMEGIEIPNPNHFGDLKLFGGGALTALSSQMLANSDFSTGAFPAEYNNALSGVFDISMRTGNNLKREHTFQLGVIGIDASSEGPIKNGGNASYLFNYRYSTLALLTPLLPENANSLKYQDLSFKFHFPTKKAGVFSWWGIGLIDHAQAKAKTDSTKWEYSNDKNEDVMSLYTAATGLSHIFYFNSTTYVKSTLASTTNIIDWNTEQLNEKLELEPYSDISSNNTNIVFTSFINRKFSAKHVNKTGVTITGMGYNLSLDKGPELSSFPRKLVFSRGFSSLIAAYTSSLIHLSDQLSITAGLNTQLFALNNHYTIEPRLGLNHQINDKHSLGFGYGLHSRLEKLNFYLNNSRATGESEVNKNLDFTKAHHFVLSYNWQLNDITHIKIEPYFQLLFDVPVIANSSFSLLNLQGDWFFDQKLQNTGKGKNYGVDFTLEKFISKGYYYLVTASVFESRYLAGDGVWHNTRYSRNHVVNALFGKEWLLGDSHQNMLSINVRFTHQGGSRFSPLNVTQSLQTKDVVYDETNPYSLQVKSRFNAHFTASYKRNKARTTQEIALKILNLTGQPDFYGYKYNLKRNTLDQELSGVVIPNLSYRIEF